MGTKIGEIINYMMDEGRSEMQTIKLISVNILRDYEVNKRISVTFSDHKISVMYGENGCGKTTILKLVNAFLSQNESVLYQEKVITMSITYSVNDKETTVSIRKKEENEIIKDENGKEILFVHKTFDWDQFNNSELVNVSSVLFGVNRGISNNSNNISEEEIYNCMIRSRYSRSIFQNRMDLQRFCIYLSRELRLSQKSRSGKNIKTRFDLSDNVLTIDDVSMDVIEELLVDRYRKARNQTISKVQKALFDTLTEEIDNPANYTNSINDDEYKRIIKEDRDRIILALESETQNPLSNRIVNILRSDKNDSPIIESGEKPLLRKLIINMHNELNDESIYLQTVNKLKEVFNKYIGPDKYLDITEDEAIIKFKNSQGSHKLELLSSGEKHLLVLLTIFVIEGNRRNLFMVDEPEISLNMAWQRDLLPLLNELAPNAEIIVASHSPSIAWADSNYLVEVGVSNE